MAEIVNLNRARKASRRAARRGKAKERRAARSGEDSEAARRARDLELKRLDPKR